ncbi:MAG: DUF3576 domain-containing protein [Alphaproteobacteria bacterium]|nr:MAG: DUF3576 domain-containing protein [Alphaproteobacteria bacterium]
MRMMIPLFSLVLLAQCDAGTTQRSERYAPMNSWEREDVKHPDRVFGEGGVTLGTQKSAPGGVIKVNAYLWRASLDVISFMPLAQVEPFTGVITTDWYQPAEKDTERFKITVLVLDHVLRADGIKVSVFKEVYQAGKGWTTAQVDQEMNEQLEETILNRARELKQESRIKKS